MRKIVLVALVLLVVSSAILGWNWWALQRPLQVALSSDPRNDGIEVLVYFNWLVDPSKIVFDVRSVSPDKSPTDVSRVLLQFAEQVEDREYVSVILSHRGSRRFMLDGSYFRQLGAEYGLQNPVYTLRTMPQNVRNLDGTTAFPEWSGGLIGVVGKQMDDLVEFHRQWYINAEVNGT